MKKITIIMPYLNEQEEVIETIKSIYQTADKKNLTIIAIDDCSDKTSPLTDFPDVISLRNGNRTGVDGSRQIGVDIAKTPYCLIIDAHMRFKNDNWAEKMIAYLEKEPETVWCTTCIGLGYGSMDLNNNKGKYYGADMLFVNAKAVPDRPSREVLEPKWASKKEGLDYELPVVLGANYFFTKKWFDHLRGLQGLQMWGTSEPFLSLKSWMAGGKCKITTDIEIGHKFRSVAPYATLVFQLVYNKIYLCKTILPQDLGDKLISFIPNDANFREAMKRIEQNREQIEFDREYYQRIFKYSIYDFCNKFNINLP